MTWSPLLDGEQARQVRSIVDDIATGLRRRIDDEPTRIDLVDGDAGYATFFAFHGDVADAERLLARASDNLETNPSPSLWSGFTGLAWALEHLPSRVLPPNEEDPCEAIDEVLAEVIDSDELHLEELLFGISGIGVYLLERLPRPDVVRALERIVDRLDSTARVKPPGRTWFCSSEGGHYNYGVAHGIPGMIAFLGRCVGAGIGGGRAERLLDDAAAWLVAQRLDGEQSLFYAQVWEGRPRIPARLAWCYGEPGIACALLLAARHARRSGLADEALAIARFGARRDPAYASIKDASMCHGAAGVGHLFNRLYHASGDSLLADAARHWFGVAIGMHRPGEGLGGYRYWRPISGGWSDEAGFLNGSTGIGLALIAATSDVEPTWDRLFLADVPPY